MSGDLSVLPRAGLGQVSGRQSLWKTHSDGVLDAENFRLSVLTDSNSQERTAETGDCAEASKID